jgi:hypothetical protein
MGFIIIIMYALFLFWPVCIVINFGGYDSESKFERLIDMVQIFILSVFPILLILSLGIFNDYSDIICKWVLVFSIIMMFFSSVEIMSSSTKGLANTAFWFMLFIVVLYFMNEPISSVPTIPEDYPAF